VDLSVDVAFAALTSLNHHRNYRWFLVGQTFSSIGTWVQTFATTWLILDLTHSAVAVGVLALCQFLPYTFFGLFAGALIDRLDPHRLVLATQGLLATSSVLLAVLTLSGSIAPWQVYLLSVVAGLVGVIDSPGRQALTFEMVGRADLARAVGLNTTSFSLGRVLGPALGGVLVAAIGVGGCFVVNVVSFVPVLAALVAVRRADLFKGDDEVEQPNVLKGTADAVRYVFKTPTVAVILAATFLLSTFSSNVNVLVPLLAKTTLNGGPETFGLISACLGVGTIAGGLAATARGRASSRTLLVAGAGMGIAELLIAAQATILTAAVLLFALGICYTLWTSNASSTLQMDSPDHLQGRAVSLYYFAFLAGAPIGGWLSGELIAAGGARLGFGVAGTAALVTASLSMARLRSLERRAVC
jgi:MFS family permease